MNSSDITATHRLGVTRMMMPGSARLVPVELVWTWLWTNFQPEKSRAKATPVTKIVEHLFAQHSHFPRNSYSENVTQILVRKMLPLLFTPFGSRSSSPFRVFVRPVTDERLRQLNQQSVPEMPKDLNSQLWLEITVELEARHTDAAATLSSQTRASNLLSSPFISTSPPTITPPVFMQHEEPPVKRFCSVTDARHRPQPLSHSPHSSVQQTKVENTQTPNAAKALPPALRLLSPPKSVAAAANLSPPHQTLTAQSSMISGRTVGFATPLRTTTGLFDRIGAGIRLPPLQHSTAAAFPVEQLQRLPSLVSSQLQLPELPLDMQMTGTDELDGDWAIIDQIRSIRSTVSGIHSDVEGMQNTLIRQQRSIESEIDSMRSQLDQLRRSIDVFEDRIQVGRASPMLTDELGDFASDESDRRCSLSIQ